MALKALEKLGAVAAFIPFVSTIPGIIKAFVYYNKAQKKDSDNLAKNKENEETAQKTNTLGVSKLLSVNQEKKECYESLWKASIAEAIPGLNFFAAVYSARVLSKLSDLREVNQSEDSKKDFLFNKFGLTKTESPAQDNFIFDALVQLDGLEAKNSPIPLPEQNKIKRALANVIFGEAHASSIVDVSMGLESAIRDFIDSTKKSTEELLGPNEEISGNNEIKEDSTLEELWIHLLTMKGVKKTLEEQKNQSIDWGRPPQVSPNPFD